jgi:ActR/RegA family two-component response regulator
MVSQSDIHSRTRNKEKNFKTERASAMGPFSLARYGAQPNRIVPFSPTLDLETASNSHASNTPDVTMAIRLLFVDDEPGIRMTLAPILERHGFEVSTAGTVSEALELINHQSFDVLLSDLNIGQPGDGFTVVSAMRRVQPEACTFILTGYPDFETALEAIRSQVDDYLLKPTDVPTLLHAIQTKMERRRPRVPEPPMKRVSELLRENVDQIVKTWLDEVGAHSELAGIGISAKKRAEHVPRLLEMLARRVDSGQPEPEESVYSGTEYGKGRAQQGYTIPLIVSEMRLLQRVISFVLQRNLIRMDLSTVIADMLEVGEGLQEELEVAIRAFEQHKMPEAA